MITSLAFISPLNFSNYFNGSAQELSLGQMNHIGHNPRLSQKDSNKVVLA